MDDDKDMSNGARQATAKPLIVFPPAFTRVDSVSRVWSGINVQYRLKYPVARTSWADVRSDRPSVIIRLEQRGGCSEPRLNPYKSIPKSRADVGFFNWIPADCPLWCYSDSVRILRDLHLDFDMSTVADILGDPRDLSALDEPHLMVYEQRVKACAHLLADAFGTNSLHDRLYGESLTVALVAALVDASGNAKDQRPTGGLTAWQLRLAKEYLEQDGTDAITLSKLAELAGLSHSRVARGFRASTGLAPYTWALHARIEKAKERLKKDDCRIAETALALGFADQSHFTKTFRRIVGTTPAEWRSRSKRIKLL